MLCFDRSVSVILPCLGIDRTAELPNGEPKRATSSTCSRRNEIFHVYTNKNKIEFNFPNHHRVSLLVCLYM